MPLFVSSHVQLWLPRPFRVTFLEMPANDREAVAERGLERAPLQAPVGAFGDADECPNAGVGGHHHGEKLLNLVDVRDELRACGDVTAAQPDAHGLSGGE